MGEEALVLGRDEGFEHALGHGGDRYEDALLARVLGQQLAVGGIEPGESRGLVVGELLVVGQPVAEMPEKACDGAGADDESGSGKSQTDLDEVEHGHFLRGTRRAFNGESGPHLCLSCGADREEGIHGSPQRPGQRHLVLPDRQQLFVL